MLVVAELAVGQEIAAAPTAMAQKCTQMVHTKSESLVLGPLVLYMELSADAEEMGRMELTLPRLGLLAGAAGVAAVRARPPL